MWPRPRHPRTDARRDASYIQGTWRRIEREVPGTRFNYEFWNRCRPKRSTYPACRAVIAAISRGPELEEPMIEAIQRAYYLEARNPSDDETLIALAEATRLERERFTLDLNSAATQAELVRQIQFAARLGARGFPSLILTEGAETRPIAHDYGDPAVVLEQLGL